MAKKWICCLKQSKLNVSSTKYIRAKILKITHQNNFVVKLIWNQCVWKKFRQICPMKAPRHWSFDAKMSKLFEDWIFSVGSASCWNTFGPRKKGNCNTISAISVRVAKLLQRTPLLHSGTRRPDSASILAQETQWDTARFAPTDSTFTLTLEGGFCLQETGWFPCGLLTKVATFSACSLSGWLLVRPAWIPRMCSSWTLSGNWEALFLTQRNPQRSCAW